MLFIVGNCTAEVSNTLKQMIAILVLMQKSDQTLEFKNSLSSERLFLNKYPELKRDFEPIAMGVLTTGMASIRCWVLVSDFLSISYLFSHYYDCPQFVRILVERNAILAFVKDRPLVLLLWLVGSSRQKYAPKLVEPIIRCINVFFDDTEIVSYFVTILCIIVIDARKFWLILSYLGEEVITVISNKGLLDIVASVGRRFTDDYARECFLILFSCVASNYFSHT